MAVDVEVPPTVSLAQAVKAYSEAVARGGPESDEAVKIKNQHSNDAEFLAFATAFDRLNHNLLRKTSAAEKGTSSRSSTKSLVPSS